MLKQGLSLCEQTTTERKEQKNAKHTKKSVSLKENLNLKTTKTI